MSVFACFGLCRMHAQSKVDPSDFAVDDPSGEQKRQKLSAAEVRWLDLQWMIQYDTVIYNYIMSMTPTHTHTHTYISVHIVQKGNEHWNQLCYSRYWIPVFQHGFCFSCFCFNFVSISISVVTRLSGVECCTVLASKALGRFATSLIWGTMGKNSKNWGKITGRLRETPPAETQLRPQYKEDVEIVHMCLESVAQSTYAKSSIGIVLAMEEREENAKGLGSLACLPALIASAQWFHLKTRCCCWFMVHDGACAFQIQTLLFRLWIKSTWVKWRCTHTSYSGYWIMNSWCPQESFGMRAHTHNI